MHIEVLILGWLLLLAVVFFIAIGKMKRIKKLMVSLVLVVLALGASFLYVEAHFGGYRATKCDISTEEILSEMPDVAITDEEISMMKALLESEEIAAAFLLAEENARGMYDFPVEEAESLLAQWIPEGFAVGYLSAVVHLETDEKRVDLAFFAEGKQHIYYGFDLDLDDSYKIISVYKKGIFGDRLTFTYHNWNGEITKWKEKRMWFRWLTEMDRYWE